jgi:hypothetical protein
VPGGKGGRNRLATEMLLCDLGPERGNGDPGECTPTESLGEGPLVDRDALSEVVPGRSLPLHSSLALGELLRLTRLPSSSVPSTSISSWFPDSVLLLLGVASFGW